MKDLSVIGYRNVFPAEVSRVGHLLLCLLHFSCPFHRNSLLLLLKPVMGDREAATLLSELVECGYLYVTDTGMGRFYAVTTQTVSYIDVEGTAKPYRRQNIAERALPTYQLQSHVIASSLFDRACAVCSEAGGFPKSEVERSAVLSAMTDTLRRGEVPLAAGYNERMYKTIPHLLMKNTRLYEAAQQDLSRQAAALNAARKSGRIGKYQRQLIELEQTRAGLERLLPRVQLLTYTSGLRVLTLDILQQNGVFIETVSEETITFGLLDNSPSGVSSRRLALRLDLIVTVSNALNLAPAVVLYTLEENKGVAIKRMENLQLPFSIPPIRFCTVPHTVQRRKVYAVNTKPQIIDIRNI